MPQHQRANPVRRFAMTVGNVSAGWIYSIDGGMLASGDVVTDKLNQAYHQQKHIGGLKYDDINISFGAGMSKAFYHWMKHSFDASYERKDGAILACDYDGNIFSAVEFNRALVSEIAFPALDAASKDVAKMGIKFRPEWTRYKYMPGGKVDASSYSVSAKKQKHWLPSNFRLSIDGLEHACKHVNKIDALTLKQKILDNTVGELRENPTTAGAIDVPNLVITLPEAHGKELFDWHDDFLIDGNCSDDDEKTGTLEYLTSDLQTVLFTITFHHLGLFKLTPDKLDAGADNLRRIKAEMYCEQITFEYHDSTWA
jgi:hypothetical protein